MPIRRFVTYLELKARFGITYCRVHLRRMMAKQQFPLCVNTGVGRIAWYEDEIVQWMNDRPRLEYKLEDDDLD